MEYDLLLEKMKKKMKVQAEGGNSSWTTDLIDIRIITKGQTRYKEKTLYLSTTSLLPDPAIPEHFIVFCYGKPFDLSLYADSAFHLVYFGEELSQAELFNLSSESMEEAPQIARGMHALMNAFFTGRGLQYLVDSAAELFGNPIYVVDLQQKYLAISSGIFPDNEFFQKENATGYISEEGISYIRQNKINEKVRKSNQPIYFFNHLIGEGTLISSIKMDGIEVGYVMIQGSSHEFRETDQELLYHFSRLISMELQKSSVFKDNKGVMYSYFLADLIKDSSANVTLVKKRLKNLGFQLKSDLYIMVIPPSSYQQSSIKLEIILQSIRTILVGSIYVVYEGNIVFLISKDKYQGFSEYELERLEDFLIGNHLKAGISNFFGSLDETSRFYRQATSAVKLGVHMNDESPICYYRDYFIYEMLQIFEKEDKEIRFLIHPGLMQLYLYDQEKGSEFIKTLRQYLVCPGQPSTVAKHLHIHKNTLLYRMGKIKEITGCDFVAGEDFMNFNLSFKIMDYLHMI